jgi:hypothetical protein
MSIIFLVALFFSMIAIRLMMTIESTQGIIACGLYQIPADRVVDIAIGVHKLALMKMSIRILSKVSVVMFNMQGIYHETILQCLAALARINTTLPLPNYNAALIMTDHDTNHTGSNKKNKTKETLDKIKN